jgi:hypothetical protein
MRQLPHVLVLLIVVLMVAACGVDPGSPNTITAGDAALYATHVQPYLEARCATLDCHGAGGRALRLYSELGLRRDPTLRATPVSEGHDPTPITDQELEDNRLAFAAIGSATSTPASHLALLKPLAVSQGGMKHKGPVHWQTTADPGYRCLRGYLVGDLTDDIPTVCAAALDATSAP